MTLERPWARVKTPAALPQPLTGEVLTELSDDGFAQLLRDQLLPRDSSGEGRAQWDLLWALLAGDDDLAERAYDVLETFLDTIEQARAAGGLEERELTRMEKFGQSCTAAWNRLEALDQPLGWAGNRAKAFNPPARRVIEELVRAIVEHRTTVSGGEPDPADRRLWSVLESVRLDPARSVATARRARGAGGANS